MEKNNVLKIFVHNGYPINFLVARTKNINESVYWNLSRNRTVSDKKNNQNSPIETVIEAFSENGEFSSL